MGLCKRCYGMGLIVTKLEGIQLTNTAQKSQTASGNIYPRPSGMEPFCQRFLQPECLSGAFHIIKITANHHSNLCVRKVRIAL